jgi:hypothetical protein
MTGKTICLPVFDLIIRALGAVLAALMAAGSALLIATATPRFWAIPVVAAVAGNFFLVWFARSTVDRRWAPWIPAVVWCVLMLLMIGPTAEGDLIANSATGLATFAAGALTFFVPAARRG